MSAKAAEFFCVFLFFVDISVEIKDMHPRRAMNTGLNLYSSISYPFTCSLYQWLLTTGCMGGKGVQCLARMPHNKS